MQVKTKFIVSVLIIFVLVGAGYTGYIAADIYFTIQTSSVSGSSPEQARQVAAFDVPEDEKDIINTLFIGVDSEDGTGRADTIMLVRYNSASREVGLVSIPRDTRVKLPERGKEKINHAHAYGGPEYLAHSVENFLEIPVHHYVQINMTGFQNSIDILGGVELTVEKDLYWSNHDGTDVIDLQAGPQVLDGDKALQYVRFRADAKGDIGRVQRQQKLLKATVDEVLQFSSITKINRILQEVRDNMTMTYNFQELIKQASAFYKIQWDEMESMVLPGKNQRIEGIWYYVVDKEEAQNYIRSMVNQEVKAEKLELGES